MYSGDCATLFYLGFVAWCVSLLILNFCTGCLLGCCYFALRAVMGSDLCDDGFVDAVMQISQCALVNYIASASHAIFLTSIKLKFYRWQHCCQALSWRGMQSVCWSCALRVCSQLRGRRSSRWAPWFLVGRRACVKSTVACSVDLRRDPFLSTH